MESKAATEKVEKKKMREVVRVHERSIGYILDHPPAPSRSILLTEEEDPMLDLSRWSPESVERVPPAG